MSAKNKELTLIRLGPDRFEIKDRGCFGLAIQDEYGKWEISPNFQDRTELVMKMINDFESRHEQ